MSKILRLLNIGEFNSLKNSLPLVAGMMDNNATTKRKAVKPSRNLLAIFVPKLHRATNFMIATGAKRHIYSLLHYGVIASYGGLIRPNKRPFTGNKSSRLFAVVETRPPFLSVGIQTTKRKGGHNHA